MAQKSQNQKHKPCEPNNRNQDNTNKGKNKAYSHSHIEDETEIEINNLETSFFFYAWEFFVLEKIIDNHEDNTESASRENISHEMKNPQHFNAFFWNISDCRFGRSVWFSLCLRRCRRLRHCFFWSYLFNHCRYSFFTWSSWFYRSFCWSNFFRACCFFRRNRFYWSLLCWSDFFCNRSFCSNCWCLFRWRLFFGICFYHR